MTLSNRGHIISQALTEETYLPEDTSQLAAVHEFLTAHELKHGSMSAARYMLVGAEKGDNVDLPKELHRVLVQVVGFESRCSAILFAHPSSRQIY